jgi:hypothetical protein
MKEIYTVYGKIERKKMNDIANKGELQLLHTWGIKIKPAVANWRRSYLSENKKQRLHLRKI